MSQLETAMLAAVVATAMEAIIVIDEQGVIQSINPAAEKLFGYRLNETIGQNVKMLMPRHFREHHDSYIDNYRRTEEKKIIGIGRVVAGERKDGSSFPMELAIAEAKVTGARIFIGFIRDLTKLEQESRRADSLQTDLLHVSRLSEMGQLASSLAHEVNQPLAAILNFTQAARHLLLRAAIDAAPSAVALIEKIEAQATRAHNIVKRLRAFVEKREVERQTEDLRIVIEEALGLAIVGSGARDLRIVLRLSRGNPHVRIDRVQIQQVLVNLIRNAADAMAELPTREIAIESSFPDPAHVRVAVSDIGPGVDPVAEAKLFTAFFTTKEQGMGIGLSICKSIIEGHDGEIGFQANSPRGATFHFTLPLARETEFDTVES